MGTAPDPHEGTGDGEEDEAEVPAVEPGARTVAFRLQYDGSHFHGMQLQPDARTVQGALEAVLGRVLRHAVRIRAAGRTDAGVHATQQMVAFEVGHRIPLAALRDLANARLAPAMRLEEGWEALPGFSPRHRACRRGYLYVLEGTGAAPDPFRARYVTFPGPGHDWERAAAAASGFVGERERWALAARPATQERTLRAVDRAELVREGGYVLFHVEAPAFLRGQIRYMVGALLRIARGEVGPGYLDELEERGRRRDKDARLAPAPPEGLYLVRVDYPDGLPGPDGAPARGARFPWLGRPAAIV